MSEKADDLEGAGWFCRYLLDTQQLSSDVRFLFMLASVVDVVVEVVLVLYGGCGTVDGGGLRRNLEDFLS